MCDKMDVQKYNKHFFSPTTAYVNFVLRHLHSLDHDLRSNEEKCEKESHQCDSVVQN